MPSSMASASRLPSSPDPLLAPPRPPRPDNLLESLVPEPHQPRAVRRTVALIVVSAFLVFLSWEAAAAPWVEARLPDDGGQGSGGRDRWGAGGRVGRWVWENSVDIVAGGYGSRNGGSEQWAVGSEDVQGGAGADADAGQTVETAGRDWNRYLWHMDLDWSPARPGRLIVIGDVHGMIDSLRSLLSKIGYRKDHDTVLLIGDLVAKHPSLQSSLDVVSYAREQDFFAVRGNHDQDVIAWRTWMEGQRVRRSSTRPTNDSETLEGPEWAWLSADSPPEAGAVAKGKIPKGWKWRSQHFLIAQKLKRIDYEWMAGRSLTLHLRELHTYFVHAGMLPWDRPEGSKPHSSDASDSLPSSYLHSTLPDSFSPASTDPAAAAGQKKEDDVSILSVAENRNPFTLLRVRGIVKGREVTQSGKKGRPWYKIWNKGMKTCQAARSSKSFSPSPRSAEAESSSIEYRDRARVRGENEDEDEDGGVDEDEDETGDADEDGDEEAEAENHGDQGDSTTGQGKGQKECRPLNIVYGHWAAKGLTTKPWSTGLDSGCVYGRSLSALVIFGSDSSSVEASAAAAGLERKNIELQGAKGELVSMPCKKP